MDLIDSSFLIAVIKQDPQAKQAFNEIWPTTLPKLHAAVEGEVRAYGKAQTPEQEAFLARFEKVEASRADQREANRVLAALRERGVTKPGYDDCLIAATARRFEARVFTRDPDFQEIRKENGVEVVRPYEEKEKIQFAREAKRIGVSLHPDAATGQATVRVYGFKPGESTEVYWRGDQSTRIDLESGKRMYIRAADGLRLSEVNEQGVRESRDIMAAVQRARSGYGEEIQVPLTQVANVEQTVPRQQLLDERARYAEERKMLERELVAERMREAARFEVEQAKQRIEEHTRAKQQTQSR